MRSSSHLPLTLALAAIVSAASLFDHAGPAAAGGGGCHGALQTSGVGSEVVMATSCFTPTVLRIEPGATINFRNQDANVHIVNGQTWSVDGTLGSGETRSVTFPLTGTYPYACSYHPGMVGVIVVGDGVNPPAESDTPVSTARLLAPSPAIATEPATQAAETSTANRQRPALWAGIGLISGAILAGTGGLWAGKRRRP